MCYPMMFRVILGSTVVATLGCGSAEPCEPITPQSVVDAPKTAVVDEPKTAGRTVAEGSAPSAGDERGDSDSRLVEWHRHKGQMDANVTYSGQSSLKLEVGEGCGGRGYKAQGATFKNLRPNQTYVVSYRYRHADCVDVEMSIGATGPGDDTDDHVPVHGTQDDWQDRSFEFHVGDNPTGWSVVAQLHRYGGCADFEGPEFQNNFVWLDDVSLERRPN